MITAIRPPTSSFEAVKVSLHHTFQRIQKAVREAFKTLAALKQPLGYLTLATVCAITFGLSWKVALVAWGVGFIFIERYRAIKIKEYVTKLLINKQFLEADPLKIEKKLKDHKSIINQVFKDLIETSWGKRWFKMENSSFQNAFEKKFKELSDGTCSGQTISLLKIMPTHCYKSGVELLNGVTLVESVRNQLIHEFRCTLNVAKDNSKWLYSHIKDPGRREKKIAKLAAAALEVKREEDLIPIEPTIALKEEYALAAPVGKGALFQKTLQEKLATFQSQQPGSIVAANLILKFNKGGHSTFVQFNGGHHRIYDLNYGLYQFPSQESLIAGLYRHLGKYDSGVITQNKLNSLKMRFYLIQPS